MKTYLILMLGTLALAHADNAYMCGNSATNMKEACSLAVVNVSALVASSSHSEQPVMARKGGGRKYRLPSILKRLREKRAREAKARTA